MKFRPREALLAASLLNADIQPTSAQPPVPAAARQEHAEPARTPEQQAIIATKRIVDSFMHPEKRQPVDFTYVVPFVTELDASDPKYQIRACGPAAITMLVRYDNALHHKPTPTLDQFITSALRHDVRTQYGWDHKRMIALSKAEYGVNLMLRDLGEQPYAAALPQLVADITRGPVALSINQGSESPNRHMIVLNGIIVRPKADGSGFETGFRVVDPIARSVTKPRGGEQRRMKRPGVYTTLDDYYLDLEHNSTNRWLAFEGYTAPEVINRAIGSGD